MDGPDGPTGGGGSPTTAANRNNNFQFFITQLPPATQFRLKIYAQNSKGKSQEISLKAQTLRPAERLIDSLAISSGKSSTSPSSSSHSNYDSTATLAFFIRSKPFLMALLIGAGLLTVAVVIVALFALLKGWYLY